MRNVTSNGLTDDATSSLAADIEDTHIAAIEAALPGIDFELAYPGNVVGCEPGDDGARVDIIDSADPRGRSLIIRATVREIYDAVRRGAPALIAAGLLLLGAALHGQTTAPKPVAKPRPQCHVVKFEDGTGALVRETATGWAKCEPTITVKLKMGKPPAKDTGLSHKLGRYYSLRSVAPDRCTVWIYEDPTTKNEGDHILDGWDLCIDSMHAEAEKTVTGPATRPAKPKTGRE